MKINNYYILGLIASLFILLTACSETDAIVPPISFLPTVEELLSVSEVVDINDQRYTMNAYLWQNLMPPVNDKALIALITISEENFNDIPTGLDVSYLWIVNRDEVWATPFSEELISSAESYELSKIAREGPEWELGDIVDVVVRLSDQNGNQYLLRVANQLITGAY